MNKNIIKKQKKVDNITKDLNDFSNFFIVEYRGLKVNSLMKLRRELRAKNMKINIYKNSFVARALSNSKLKINLENYVEGPNAFVFSNDEITCPKILSNFSKENEKLVIKCGFVNNKIINAEEIKTISNLPSKEELILMFLNCLKNPISKCACIINELVNNKKRSTNN